MVGTAPVAPATPVRVEAVEAAMLTANFTHPGIAFSCAARTQPPVDRATLEPIRYSTATNATLGDVHRPVMSARRGRRTEAGTADDFAAAPVVAVARACRASATGSMRSFGVHPKMSHNAINDFSDNRSGVCATRRYTCVADNSTPRSASNGCRSLVAKIDC